MNNFVEDSSSPPPEWIQESAGSIQVNTEAYRELIADVLAVLRQIEAEFTSPQSLSSVKEWATGDHLQDLVLQRKHKPLVLDRYEEEFVLDS